LPTSWDRSRTSRRERGLVVAADLESLAVPDAALVQDSVVSYRNHAAHAHAQELCALLAHVDVPERVELAYVCATCEHVFA
jgi:hypothetical protein